MRAITETAPQRFFATRPTPCPYLDDRMERKVFTELTGSNADELHHVLANNGFRRSQNIAYRPFCENCSSCVAIRVILGEFRLKRWMRRVMNRNSDLLMSRCPPRVTQEQYNLFNRYLAERHATGGMADMTFDEYQSMVEDSAVTTEVVEFRNSHGELVAACLVDVMDDGLSLIYSFFCAGKIGFEHRKRHHLVVDRRLSPQWLGICLFRVLDRRQSDYGLQKSFPTD